MTYVTPAMLYKFKLMYGHSKWSAFKAAARLWLKRHWE